MAWFLSQSINPIIELFMEINIVEDWVAFSLIGPTMY